MSKLMTNATPLDLFKQTEDAITQMGWEHEGHGGLTGAPFNRDASWRLSGEGGNYLHLSLFCEERNEEEDKRRQAYDEARAANMPADLSDMDPTDMTHEDFASVLTMKGTAAMLEEWKRLHQVANT